MKTKKIASLILCMVMLLSIFSGCGAKDNGNAAATGAPSATAAPATPADTSTPAAPEVKYKDELIFANAIDVTSADKMENNTVIGWQIWNLIYDGLTYKDPETAEIKLALAESVDTPSDTEYIFHLKKGVKFHNGDELTSKDVVHTYERACTMPANSNYVANIESCEAVDDYTVKYTLKQPSAVFMEYMAETSMKIESKKAYEDNGNAFINCGTGPYKFVERVPSDHITVEKFDDCWDTGAVTKRITMRVIPEGSARVIALQNGEVDIALEPPTIDLNYIRDDANCELVQLPACKLDYFSFNSQKAPFNDYHVRHAMAMVVNKQEIIDVVLEGNGRPANNVVGYGTKSYTDDLTPIPYDVEAAKKELAEAGYPNGFKFSVTLNGDTRERVAQVLQAQFSQLGIEMTINNWDNATHRQHINSGEFDSSVSAWSNSGDPDIILRNLFHSSMVGVNNRTWLADPGVDEQLDTLVTLSDEDARIKGYKSLQQELLDTCVMVPLYYETLSIGVRSNVEGIKFESGGAHWYRYAYAVE